MERASRSGAIVVFHVGRSHWGAFLPGQAIQAEARDLLIQKKTFGFGRAGIIFS
jgi:hypothetical protein